MDLRSAMPIDLEGDNITVLGEVFDTSKKANSFQI